jgi:hypothetical protein
VSRVSRSRSLTNCNYRCPNKHLSDPIPDGADAVIEAIDSDNDGEISFNEFLAWMNQLGLFR